MSYEIMEDGRGGNYVRAEDDDYTYIVKFDTYYTETIVDMAVIHKRSAERQTPNLNHYYKFGQLKERYRLFTELKKDHV